jgi:hypothetical protein
VLVLAILLSLTAFVAAQEEALRIHRDIADLTDEASVIVHGTIVSSKIEPHPQFNNLNTVVVTMSVASSLKGSAPKTLTFRQYVWDIRSLSSNGGYHKGEELLLFLRPESQYGLTSPAGLQQGRFEITRDAKGNPLAMNGEHNAGLFTGVSAKAQQRRAALPASAQKLAAQRPGPVQLADLEQVVRAFAGTTR